MVKISEFKNGLKLVYEKISHTKSLAIGLLLRAGSMHENDKENGISHFLEHMTFKGTNKYSAKELAEAIDALGGNVNAYTSKTDTVYYAQVLSEKMKEAMEFLSDIVLNPKLDAEDIEREKQVVLEEIAMAEDNPEDVSYDKLNEVLYCGGTLSRPILGSTKNVEAFTKEEIVEYRKQYYSPNQAILSVVGNFDEEELLKIAKKCFLSWKRGEDTVAPVNSVSKAGQVIKCEKQIEQVHMCLAYPGKSDLDEDLHTLAVLSNIFGGGVSSRLFQAVREEKALVYSIYSSISSFPSCGDLSIYAAASLKNKKKVIDEIYNQINIIVDKGIKAKELEQTKIQLKTSIVLSQESSYRKMSKFAGNLLHYGRVIPIEETLAKIDAIDENKVHKLAKEIFAYKPCVSLVGPKSLED